MAFDVAPVCSPSSGYNAGTGFRLTRLARFCAFDIGVGEGLGGVEYEHIEAVDGFSGDVGTLSGVDAWWDVAGRGK